jgi:hypothetical protein
MVVDEPLANAEVAMSSVDTNAAIAMFFIMLLLSA